MTMNYTRSFKPVFFSTLVVLSVTPAFLHAAEIANPTLYTTMDPGGGRDITLFDGANATTQATLEALNDFSVIRDFAAAVDGTNVVAFTDATMPDIQISFVGGLNSATGSVLTNSGFITSPGSGIKVVSSQTSATHAMTGTIDFGSWDGSFTSNVNAVSAAAFTLAQPGRWQRMESVVVTFLGADDSTVINTQTILGSSIVDKTSSQGLYFGYQAGSGESIGSAVFTVNVNLEVGTQDDPLLGLDDISFAAIPEPATSVSLLGGVVLLLSLGLRRR
jgi:hypothetical protein